MNKLVVSVVTSLALGVAGCGGSTPASELAKAPEFNPKGQTKCSIAASQARPLIVEWPSTDRGDLEAAAKKGVVAVRYSGCEMEVLRRCAVEAGYGYTPFTRKDDRISIRDADELYANVPIGAVKLEGKLEKAGQLTVTMTAVGKLEAQLRDQDPLKMRGDCTEATHLVTGVTVGAFEFYAGADAEVGGGVDVMGAGAGAKSVASRELLNRDGNRDKCGSATNQDDDPPDGCGAFLRLEVTPLADVMGNTRVASRRKRATAAAEAPSRPSVRSEPPVAIAGIFGNQLLTLALARDGGLFLRKASGWSSQGLAAKTVPALAANRDGRTTALVVDRAGKLRMRSGRGGSWTGAGAWSTIANAGVVDGAVALVPTSKDVLAAFVRTPVGSLTHVWQSKPGSDTWSNPLDLRGTLRTDPIALTDGEGRLVVVGMSPGEEIQLIAQERAYGPWGDWMSLGAAEGSVAPVATGDGLAVVAVRKGKLAVTRRTGLGGWRDWQPLATTPAIAQPRTVVVSRFGAPTMIVVQDHEGSLHWGLYEPGSTKVKLEALPGRFVHQPMLGPGSFGVELAVRSDDGVLLGHLGNNGFGGWRKHPAP